MSLAASFNLMWFVCLIVFSAVSFVSQRFSSREYSTILMSLNARSQQTVHNRDPNALLVIVGMSVGLSYLFLYCFYGKRTNVYYTRMGQSLFESNWYLLPCELQRFYVLMIANAQLPVNYHGMNVCTLDLERFSKARMGFTQIH